MIWKTCRLGEIWVSIDDTLQKINVGHGGLSGFGVCESRGGEKINKGVYCFRDRAVSDGNVQDYIPTARSGPLSRRFGVYMLSTVILILVTSISENEVIGSTR